jgi:hypothetical protein
MALWHTGRAPTAPLTTAVSDQSELILVPIGSADYRLHKVDRSAFEAELDSRLRSPHLERVSAPHRCQAGYSRNAKPKPERSASC